MDRLALLAITALGPNLIKRGPSANTVTRVSRAYVRVGSLPVPGADVASVLFRYSKPLVCENEDRDHPYSIRGTCTGLNLGGRYFYCFCRHQIAGYDPSKVSIFPTAAGGKVHIGGGTSRFVEHSDRTQGEEFLDVFGMEIDPKAYEIPNLESEFFPVTDNDCWPKRTTGDLFAYGVPFELQNYLLREEDGGLKELNFRTVLVSARHNQRSNASWVQRAEFIRTGRFSPNGMSGGPVFHIGRDDKDAFVGLAGMIMRGGDTHFHFIESGFLQQFGNT